jgi:alpha-glucosidase
VPLPWTRAGPSLGFGAGAPWLPQPAEWSALSAEAEEADRASMLWLYRDALRVRRELPELQGDGYSWLESGDDVIAFSRGEHFACVVNFGGPPIDLPPGELLVSSVPLDGGLPADAAAWVRLA